MDQAEVTSKTPELQGLPETSRFICPNGVCPAVVTTRRDGALAPTMDDVAAVFHLPIDRAAKQLNVGQTWLKHMCREHGVPRWPFRKIQSLLSSAQRLEESIADVDPNSGDPSERERYQKVNEQIQQLYSARAAICRGQCPELSAVSAQDALKAAARRGRAAAASRHMKQVCTWPCKP